MLLFGGNDVYDARGGGILNGVLDLGSCDDRFDGRGGTVTGEVRGGTGDDTYIVDDDSITLVENASEGTDKVRSKGDYTLAANFETLTLIGSASVNGIGNNAANTINGNGGDNHLNGQGGSDTINGDDGNDMLRGGNAADLLRGDNGDDTLKGGKGNDTLRGGDDDDMLRGGQNNDQLRGEDGDDWLKGGTGQDTLRGRQRPGHPDRRVGARCLSGGSDADVLRFTKASDSPNGSADTITDFEVGVDVIDLSAVVQGAVHRQSGRQQLLRLRPRGAHRRSGRRTPVCASTWVAMAPKTCALWCRA